MWDPSAGIGLDNPLPADNSANEIVSDSHNSVFVFHCDYQTYPENEYGYTNPDPAGTALGGCSHPVHIEIPAGHLHISAGRRAAAAGCVGIGGVCLTGRGGSVPSEEPPVMFPVKPPCICEGSKPSGISPIFGICPLKSPGI